MGSAFQQQAEVAALADLHTPVGQCALAVRNALLRGIGAVAEQHTILRAYVVSRHQFHVGELHHAVSVGNHVAQLDKGMPPRDRFKSIEQEMVEPLALKDFRCVLVLVARIVRKYKGFEQRLVVALSEAAREVHVNKRVGIDGIQRAALGVLDVESHSPRPPPPGNVLFG